jgi:hypothetical protein
LRASSGGRLVGRDHFRTILGAKGLGTPKQEAEVTALQDRLIAQGLQNDEYVYVDDQNLKSAYVSRLIGLAQKYNAFYVIEDMTFLDVQTCLDRNEVRDRPVPSELIVTNYEKYVKGKTYPLPVPKGKLSSPYLPPEPYVPPTGGIKAVLVDVDGTVADHTGIRGHHEYDKVGLDLPKYDVIKMVRAALEGGYTPIFLSGRPEKSRYDTRQWLNRHVTTAGSLLMRQDGDHRADYIVKKELFDEYVRNTYRVAVAFDDRNQVVDMYREMGLTVLQVAEGNF